MQSKIPITKLSRGKVVGKAIFKIGVTQSKGVVKRAFMSKSRREESKNKTHAEIAKVIIESLGTLKGVSVKIAQQVALGLPFLPKEYLDEISKSFNTIPPINKALIRKVIKQEFGKYPQNIFDSFNSEPFGSASLGQVHLAYKNNTKLAVKVQYPAIAKSIKSDLTVLKFALSRFAKGGNIDHLMKEIEDRLYEEVDYYIEADNSEHFLKNFKHDLIVIPAVYRNLSTQKVITTSFLEGRSFQEFLLSNPIQKERNHYAQLIFDSFFIGLYHLQMIHADPNPGNFIFMENRKLGLIDFGCVKRLNDAFLVSFSKLHVSLMDKLPDEEITKQYVDLRMIDKDTPEKMLEFYQEVIKPLDRIYIEIFETDSYDFKENKNFSERGFKTIIEVQKKGITTVQNMNEEYIFVDRTLLGYYAMFEQMEAKIDTQFAQRLIRY
jgi:predicted unusual protein kinase regulating ubiquinone biosynthesis (AarF/ABC1/UbiB family)